MSKFLDIRKQLLLDELKARTTMQWNLESMLFPEQLAFVKDPRRRKTAVCSRRSGKSYACAADLLDTALNKPNATLLYITLTRASAKRLVWRECDRLIKAYKLPFLANNSDLTLSNTTNGSIIYFGGASDITQIEIYRGFKLDKVYLDEVQSMPPFIKELVDDVLSYATLDSYGELLSIGTPGPIPSGYFFDISHSKNWSNHKWNIINNPHAVSEKARAAGKNIHDILKEEREYKGQTESTPAYMREALGLWVHDTDSLVYKYNEKINHFDELPAEDLTYVIGADIGFADSDAIAVLGFSKTQKKVYLVEEYLKAKNDITDLAQVLKRFEIKYKPIKIVIDAGALGKKIVEELRLRHQLNLVAAEKSRKAEFIELLNDALRSSQFKVKKDSRLAADYFKIEWEILSKEKRVVSRSFHSDISDAVLYAFRASRHFLAQTPQLSDLSFEAEEERYLEELDRKHKEAKTIEWWEK